MKPQWYFYIFWICLLFLRNFLVRVGQEQNGTMIFVFHLSRPFQTYFGFKWSHNYIFFKFLNFFLFFWNFLLRVRLERNRMMVFTWNEAIIVFYNFLYFFAFCLEFSISHWVGTKRNDNLYFLTFSAFSNQFSLEKKP